MSAIVFGRWGEAIVFGNKEGRSFWNGVDRLKGEGDRFWKEQLFGVAIVFGG